MAIQVICPNGHALRVKDKYSGQSGLCPRCHARMRVPKVLTDDEIVDLMGPVDPKCKSDLGHDEVHPPKKEKQASGVSLLGSSIIRHKKVCPDCAYMYPTWYATCPNCAALEERSAKQDSMS